MQEGAEKQIPSLWQLCRYFLALGLTGFGGPVALTASMHLDLVKKLRWFSEEDFRKGLALANLSPGPLATQQAIFLGWHRGRILGSIAIALSFIFPGFVIIVALAWLYGIYGELPATKLYLESLNPIVFAVVFNAAIVLGRDYLGKNRALWLIAFLNALASMYFQAEVVWLFIVSGVGYFIWERKKAPGAMLSAAFVIGENKEFFPAIRWHLLGDMFWYFFEVGAFVFGSGFAILAFMHHGLVVDHKWLTEQQYLDALAVALATPGPAVLAVAFIGFLMMGLVGATVATLGMFLPCWLFTVLPAPFMDRLGDQKSTEALVLGMTAAAVGAIFGALANLGKTALGRTDHLVMAAVAMALIVFFPKLQGKMILIAIVTGLLAALF